MSTRNGIDFNTNLYHMCILWDVSTFAWFSPTLLALRASRAVVDEASQHVGDDDRDLEAVAGAVGLRHQTLPMYSSRIAAAVGRSSRGTV